MKSILRYGLYFLLALAVVKAGWASADVGSVSEEKIRVLLVTGGHGYEKAPFQAMFESIKDVITTPVEFPAAADRLRPESAAEFDVVVFYDMWMKGITADQQKRFVKLLESGIGVVALHHTLAAHPSWPEYAKIIGGKYYVKSNRPEDQSQTLSTYAHGQDIPVKIAAANHPITRGLPDFVIHDETYQHYHTDPNAQVLLTTDHGRSDPELAWVNTYGNSRIFYLQLGHDHHAYEHPEYRQLVARGIRWAAGRAANPEAPQQSLFNGRDLTGWQVEGGARWEVKDGLLIGRQGEGNAPGDLLTEASYDDFELQVTFRMIWPANSGVWYRYQAANKCFQADILEYRNPYALTGSLYCPGKMFIAKNTDPKLVNREGWNTLLIRTVGNRQVIFLNGTKVADIRDDTSDRGRIGFQVHAGNQFGKMQVQVKQMLLRGI